MFESPQTSDSQNVQKKARFITKALKRFNNKNYYIQIFTAKPEIVIRNAFKVTKTQLQIFKHQSIICGVLSNDKYDELSIKSMLAL